MKFNVRIYGVLINSNNEVLLSDERFSDRQFTKFPGGGLEFGEGTKEGLKREFMEELGLEIEVGNVIYVTDFFVESSFNPQHQVIGIYYTVTTKNWNKIKTSTKKFDFPDEKPKQEVRRWKKLSELTPDDVTFPTDKVVVELITTKM